MEYLERLDEAIEKTENALNKSEESKPGLAACRDVGMREKRFMHRTAVRKVGFRATKFTIRNSESECDKSDVSGVAKSSVMGAASNDHSREQPISDKDSPTNSHEKEDSIEAASIAKHRSPTTHTRVSYPIFHHTAIFNTSNPRFSEGTFSSEHVQSPSSQTSTLQGKCSSKEERKAGLRLGSALRSFRNVLGRKIRDLESAKIHQQEASILKIVLGASQRKQAVIKNVCSSLYTTEANEAALEILKAEQDLIKEIKHLVGQDTLEEKDHLDLLIEEVNERIAEIRAHRRAGSEEGKCEENDEASHKELRLANEMEHAGEENLDSKPAMEFEKAIVRCFISLSKEDINDVVRKYMMASQCTMEAKEIKTVLNDRVFRNCLGLQVAKSIHFADTKTMIKALDGYRRFVGSVAGIISKGSLDMDERFVKMITESIGRLQHSSDPFTCKMAVQSMLCRRYVEDMVELKRILARFSSLDI